MLNTMTNRMMMVALLAVVPMAALGNGMGIFFSDSEFTDLATDADGGATPLDAYIVVLDSEYATVGGYECSISFNGVAPVLQQVEFPAGSDGNNFETDVNHLVIFGVPQPAVGGAVVLCRLSLLADDPSTVEILLGPSTPSSVPGQPVIVDGADPDTWVGCGLTSGDDIPGVVATINGGGITAEEGRRLSAVRGLFR